MCEFEFWRKHPIHDMHVSTCGNIDNIKKRKCTARVDGGYVIYRFTCKDGKRRKFRVHRLVGETWMEAEQLVANSKCNNQAQVNHKDHNPLNNHLNNLEWCTPSENVHAWHRFKGTNKK
jgi:hypothetical protein